MQYLMQYHAVLPRNALKCLEILGFREVPSTILQVFEVIGVLFEGFYTRCFMVGTTNSLLSMRNHSSFKFASGVKRCSQVPSGR